LFFVWFFVVVVVVVVVVGVVETLSSVYGPYQYQLPASSLPLVFVARPETLMSHALRESSCYWSLASKVRFPQIGI